ncbi:MAG: signal peptidase I [Candidatus Magasanikbacteria bacterium]|jgi:signal peptidase I|nr:signal peptidase I [Candidatus Magasanikbacteria bacterium]
MKEKKEEQLEEQESLSEVVEDMQEVVTAAERGFVSGLGAFFIEVLKILFLAVITIVIVRYFLFKPFYVKGASMEPTYYASEYLIVDELTYRFRTPERGEVVVFEAPIAEKDFYIKRVIALPGERVKVAQGKVVIYNEAHPQGFVLDETYIVEETPGSDTLTVAEGEYYVLGDNRNASLDSRTFGAISENLIVGRAWLRGWPFTRLGIIHSPTYTIEKS